MNVTEILSKLYPNDAWSVVGDPQSENEFIEALVWNSENPKPTWSKIESSRNQIEYEIEYEKVSEKRKFFYSQESDPIFFQWQRKEKTEQEWLDSIASINARFPYPQNPSI